MIDVAATDLAIGDLAGLSRADRLELLRRKISAVPTKGEIAVERLPVDGREVLAVPAPLAELLPRRGLARGSVSMVSGASSVLLGILAAVTQAGLFAAVVGLPKLGLLAAIEMGARLDRLALIPEPGPDPAGVAGVLLDGIDLVVLGLGGATLSPSRARAVMARARSKRAVLLVTEGQIPGAEVVIDARVDGYSGMGHGEGRIKGIQLAIRAQSKALGVRRSCIDLRWQTDMCVEWAPREPVRHESSFSAVVS